VGCRRCAAPTADEALVLACAPISTPARGSSSDVLCAPRW
jgi:hypothetical protein